MTMYITVAQKTLLAPATAGVKCLQVASQEMQMLMLLSQVKIQLRTEAPPSSTADLDCSQMQQPLCICLTKPAQHVMTGLQEVQML